MKMNKIWRKYLIWFAQEHVEFRFAEMESLLKLLNIEMKYVEKPSEIEPYWIVELSSEEDVKRLANRSVSIRSCLELWGKSDNVNSLHDLLKRHPKQLMEQYFKPEITFKIEVETFCKHITQKEKVNKLETFSYLPFQGSVKLKDPDVTFQYIEYYGIIANNPPDSPYHVFFGRFITNGLRQLIKKFSLKTRKFIGNTSMDPQLAFLMANQAQIKNGDIVLDPFVGSGSLLVAAAQFGGYVLGTDIDYLMLHARTRPSRIKQKKRDKDESIRANMKQYNLEDKYLDVMVNDFAMPFWKDNMEFDAIVTDPPYGIREATEKIGTSKENYKISEEHLSTHIPAKIEYGIVDIYQDLLQFATKHLKLNGKLVCWFPVYRNDYNENGLPSNSCLKLLANSEQILSKTTSRRLLTFEKVKHPISDDDPNLGETQIVDFREKYFIVREETRKQRRMREAQKREDDRLKYLKK